MKDLIIVGARGFGRDVYDIALQCSGYKKEYRIKGFLDISKDALDAFHSYPPILDSYENYIVKDNDVFICAFGDVQSKKKCIQTIMGKRGSFISLIHPSAHIDKSAKIGTGCIVHQNATLCSGSIIGDFVLIQISTIVGHDVKIGNYSRVDSLAMCVGGVEIEDEVTIYTSAVINHNVTVRKGAFVGAGSFVIREVKESSSVHGNPATRLI